MLPDPYFPRTVLDNRMRTSLIAYIGVWLIVICGCKDYKSPDVENLVRLKHVGLLIKDFASVNHGDFPSDLIGLSEVPSEIVKTKTARSRAYLMRELGKYRYVDPKSKCQYDWVYFRGYTTSSPVGIIIAAAPTATRAGKNDERRAILYSDFSCKIVSEQEFLASLWAQESLLRKQ